MPRKNKKRKTGKVPRTETEKGEGPKNVRRSLLETIKTSGWIQNLSVAALGLTTAVICESMGMSAFKTTVISACAVLTLLIWIVGFGLIRANEHPIDRASIRFKVRTAMVPSDRGALFFVRYTSRFAGDTLVPLPIALIISITNTRQVPVTLDKISVEARENTSQWKKLKHVPILGQRVYWIYGDFKNAALLDFSKNGIEQLLNGKPVASNVPAQGWIFFEKPSELSGATGNKIQFRFSAQDTEGNKYEVTTEQDTLKNQVETGADADVNPAVLDFTGRREDLSALPISGGHDPVFPMPR